MRAESKGVGCRQRRLEVGARLAQRTANIQPVSVTLDVLKNSGWLNARACCQKKHAKSRRAENQAWVPQKVPEKWSQQERLGARDRPHLEHTAHVRHTRRVEPQQLVESCRALPCQKERANAGWEDVRALVALVAWEVTGPSLEIGKRGAHVKHVSHACDISCIKIQRLVEH